MSGEKKSDDGKGVPPGGEGKTAEPKAVDARLIPGGSFKSAQTAIGMNAVDRTLLPSFGKTTDQADYKDTPGTAVERPPRAGEPSRGPGSPR